MSAQRTIHAQIQAHIAGCHHNDVDGAVCVGCSLLQEQADEIERLRKELAEALPTQTPSEDW